MDAIWAAVMRLYGEYGASRTGLSLIDFDAEKQLAVIRVTLSAVNTVRAAIATITRAKGKPAAIHVLRTSGTLKSLREK